MKRKRRSPAARRPSDLQVEADIATDMVAKPSRPRPGNRVTKLELPHERDQSTHAPGPPRDVTAQAARDVDQGKVDTDCYAATGTRFDRKRRRG
jgi:hypothetical protein